MTTILSDTLRPGMYLGSRPLRVNKKGQVTVQTERGLQVNSLLRADEWQMLDERIQTAARTRLTALNQLRTRGLVRPINSFGVLTTQWSQGGEMTAASADMTGEGRPERDRQDFKIQGRPVPIIYKDFRIPKREMEAARLLGTQLDTSHATEAARVVAEKLEDMLVNGDAGVIFGGNTIYGYTTETNRNTGSATGDWGTITNILPTITAMIAAANGDRYFGPFVLKVATQQYAEISTSFFTDGSGQSALQRALLIPQLEEIIPVDTLAAGSLVLAQMTEDVVDYAEHMGITVVEWMSADGMIGYFRVMAVGTPRVKSDYGSRSGVVHYTGA